MTDTYRGGYLQALRDISTGLKELLHEWQDPTGEMEVYFGKDVSELLLDTALNVPEAAVTEPV